MTCHSIGSRRSHVSFAITSSLNRSKSTFVTYNRSNRLIKSSKKRPTVSVGDAILTRHRLSADVERLATENRHPAGLFHATRPSRETGPTRSKSQRSQRSKKAHRRPWPHQRLPPQ